MIKTISFALAALMLLPCTVAFCQNSSEAFDGSASPAGSVVDTAALGGTKNPHRLEDLFFGGQFSKEDLSKIKEQKIGRIITLRTEGEIDWDEKEAVEAAGLEFVEIPFRKPESLTDSIFDRVRESLGDSDTPTLFHCGSANRVGGVWLPYRVLDQGVDLETALAEAKVIGLRAPFIEEKAIDYIKRQRAASTMTGEKAMTDEKSVKPGVNDSFLNPKLDVDSFVKKFEIESREVYLAREAIVAACEIERGDTIGDVGAGTGLFTRLFSGAVGEEGWVYAIDIAPRFIQHINSEAASRKLNNITGVLCAENSVNLPPNSIDVVFICDVYHHFEFPMTTLASIKRALKTDGHMIVIDFERIEGTTKAWTLGHVRAGKEVFRAEIQDAGFTLVDDKQVEGLKENYCLKFRKDQGKD